MIEFRTEPAKYRHWKMTFAGPVAILAMDVDENCGIAEGYELKLNSYDLGVDIELYDATQRLRFEHPEVRSIILTSAKERIFCAGANIKMLGLSSHPFKVNFCKFTNETRNCIEDATRNSGQFYMAAIGGPCAGGGYELALATDYILMADDGSTSISLPEVPLLAVLPGTGGLTRLVDKRGVRRDLADFFCTTEEGVKGKRAVDWRLVDEVVPRTQLNEAANQRAQQFASKSNRRPVGGKGVTLAPVSRAISDRAITYDHLKIELDRDRACANFLILGPAEPVKSPIALGCDFWPLAVARELDDAILHLRFNEEGVRTWVFRTQGDSALVESYDAFLLANAEDWLVREIILLLKRTLKRVDVSARSTFALVEPGSCFAGSLLELALGADRAFMLRGPRDGDEAPPARIVLTDMNFGRLPMCNGLSRLESRFLREPEKYLKLRAKLGEQIGAEAAQALGLISFTPDDLDWDDEVRLAIEERAAFSGDALTGMEASLRFGGPETIESKIFARLSAWQNWIFQRPNAVGEKGALKLYGTGRRPEFDPRRV